MKATQLMLEQLSVVQNFRVDLVHRKSMIPMNRIPFFLVLLFPFVYLYSGCAHAQQMDATETELWEPIPPVVAPLPVYGEPPEDAIILFDGTSMDAWMRPDGQPPGWSIEDGMLVINPGRGDIITREKFGDIQLHLEWSIPVDVRGSAQGRGNSGIFLQSRYEVQVLDNWENPSYVNGMAGSIYKQHIPLANPARPPGEWQTYQIFYKAPVFDQNGQVERPARVTVLLNGVLVQNNVEIYGPTVWRGLPEYSPHGIDGIRLQNHSSGNRVRFRNIWVRRLD